MPSEAISDPGTDDGNKTRRRIRTFVAWGVGLVAVYALLGFFAVPPILKPILERELSTALGRTVSIERLRTNPFSPSATVEGLVIREPSGDAQFITIEELYLNLGWNSIVRLAPVVDEVAVRKAHLQVIRNPDRTYNFQDLADEALAALRSDEPTPRFAVFNIVLADGSIDIDDRAEAEKHTVRNLRIGIPFISSLPADVDVKVTPELSALLNGAMVDLKGSTLPFKETRATALNVDLDKFDLTRLVDYLPFELRGTVISALLDTRLVIAFEQPAGSKPQIKIRGSAAVTQLSIHDLQGRPMVASQRIAVDVNEIDALAPSVDLKSLDIEGPDVHIRREKAGGINLERVGIVAAEGDQIQRQSRQKTGKAAVPVKFGALNVNGGTVRFTDETTTPEFDAIVRDVQLVARDFDNTLKDKANKIEVSARTEAGESLRLDVATTADPRSAEGRLEVDKLRLKGFQPYVSQASNLLVDDGRFDIGFGFKWVSDLSYEKHELSISDLQVALKGFRARLNGEKEPLFQVASIEVAGAGGELKSRTADLGTIVVRDATMRLERERDGKLNLERIPRSSAKETPLAAPQAAGNPQPASAPWQWQMGSFTLERSSVVLEDRAGGQPLALDIAPVQLTVKNFSNAKGHRSNVDLRATIEKRGKLAARGVLSVEPLAGSFNIDAGAIEFARLQHYFDERINFIVTSGAVSLNGKTDFQRSRGGGMEVSYAGRVGVDDFATVDKSTRSDLIKWKSLSIGAAAFNLAPLKIGLGQIALNDFYGRIILSPDGRFNLQDLVQPAAASTESKAGTAAKPSASPGGDLTGKLRIGPTSLKAGAIDFSDHFIKPNFSAKLSDIHGTLGEMTHDRPSDIRLLAKGERALEVEILGKLNALAPQLFLDIEGKAKDISLPPLSTYSMKYLGYKIERGKLTLKVRYHVENHKLAAENNIVLDQLTFGEKVENPDATKLPVPAAVAILKDRNGVIDVNVPISGSLDDPQFSVTAAAVQAVGNLITKVVTAPFSVLGASVGGGEELSYVEFAPGSATLDAAGVGKLRTLTKLLNERPKLKLDVIGRVDPVADRDALERAPSGDKETRFSDKELQRLAGARADAARRWLVEEGKVAPSRIYLVAPKLTAEGIKDKGKPTRVDFSVQ